MSRPELNRLTGFDGFLDDEAESGQDQHVVGEGGGDVVNWWEVDDVEVWRWWTGFDEVVLGG